ncbi:DUF2157 domain-containing protein [Bacillus subtilis]|uniref:DUF2157 domain-containing protein n=1 Tax=Pseudochrobactrum asaccharolyticum TaxID=354351 RepID=UPI001F2D74A7|nr:DUF2157 domain-containing protein [Pseudochrobactrum asaccharolyticum]MCF7644864.1 DUF2157 domain-containing protein [Pseudochrobactrum asaccharolyticum]MCF7671708.1 DUF2157 domain-containing protein [Bacillus subtilis]
MSLFVSLARQIDQWQSQGLLDQETADKLRIDVKTRHNGFGMGGVLAVLGSLLLGAALILFIAANWEVIPRIWRVALILFIMWGGYLGGAWLQQRSDNKLAAIFAPSLYLLSAITYGAGLALVGQMYHMSGDLTTAALAWGVGVLIAGVLLRAPILISAALGIGGFYLYTVLNEIGGQINLVASYRWVLPLYIAACAVAIIYTKADKAMHLLAMLSLAYLLALYLDLESAVTLVLMIVLGTILIICQGRWPSFERYSYGFGSQLAGYGLAALLLVLFIFQVEHKGVFNNYEVGADAVYSLTAIAVCVFALIIAGEKSGQLRWFAYAGFSLHVLYLATVTVGTMIGTSGVFMIGGLLVMGLAFLVTRMEKYLHGSAVKAVSVQDGEQQP